MYESCELGGTIVAKWQVKNGSWAKIGDRLWYGRQDVKGGYVTRIWAEYLDDILLDIKLCLVYKNDKQTHKLIINADDSRLRLF